MKLVKYIFFLSVSLLLFSCSEDVMDDINIERNSTTSMSAKNILPDAMVKTFYETTSTDLAWYATVYCEHSAGTWAQSKDADIRNGQEASSLVNNSWNNMYNLLTVCKTMLDKTDPLIGDEKDNYWVRGIAFTLTAYNLAVATDSWGEIPWTEAGLGTANLKPRYENQSVIYGYVQAYLDSAIVNLNKATVFWAAQDLIYGSTATTLANNKAAWLRVAYSLKARYYMRLSQKGAANITAAIAAIPNGFTTAAQGFIFNRYDTNTGSTSNKNPWWEFRYVRAHLSVSSTLYNLMATRNDTRRPYYFTLVGGVYVPAPIGTALEVQAGTYSRSIFTNGNNLASMAAASPMMTYHELKFIEAEARFRNSDATYTTALQQAVVAKFVAVNATTGAADGAAYYTAEVAPRLTVGNELNEILTQKYIALYEAEALEAYADVRRTGIPAMLNPANATVGFPHRFPYALSEESSNGANVPVVDIYADKVWWAGGAEKL
jgi:hypothetical protein